MEMDVISIAIAAMGLAIGYSFHKWMLWRERAYKAHEAYREALTNFEAIKAQWNKLDDERRRNHEAIMETFDVLNELPDNPDRWPVEQVRQCRNVLLFAIQNSTYGRE